MGMGVLTQQNNPVREVLGKWKARDV